MKTNKILIVFISILLVLTVGCGNGIKNEGNKIIIKKQIIDSADKYVHLNKEISKELFKMITGKELGED